MNFNYLRCSTCKIFKPLDNFSNNKATKTRKLNNCKDCFNEKYNSRTIICECSRKIKLKYHKKHLTSEIHKNTLEKIKC